MTRAVGIDASVYNGSLGHLLHSVDFVIARASIGSTIDGRYSLHASETLHAGAVLGAYHFAIKGVSAARQAATMLGIAQHAAFLAVDDEGVALTAPATVRAIISALHREDSQRRHVGLYSSDGTWPGDLGQDFDWVADWSHEPGRAWRFWQSRGSPIDHDEYHGTVAELQTWAKTRRTR